jgi:Holliday junction resolvasome RuvABC endonuclease subunit
MLYLGIDPGFSGAWGLIDHHGQYRACGDMHHTDKYLLTQFVFEEIVDALHGDDHEVVVETVHSMPKQGVASSFKFGVAYGGAVALAERLNSAWHMVTPQVWKKALKLDSDKQKSLDLARQLWPDAPLKRQKDNGRAEALLMAYWLRKEYGHD